MLCEHHGLVGDSILWHPHSKLMERLLSRMLLLAMVDRERWRLLSFRWLKQVTRPNPTPRGQGREIPPDAQKAALIIYPIIRRTGGRRSRLSFLKELLEQHSKPDQSGAAASDMIGKWQPWQLMLGPHNLWNTLFLRLLWQIIKLQTPSELRTRY